MKSRRDIALHMSLTDTSVNVSLTFAKIRRRIRDLNPTYPFNSFYRMRLLNRRAIRRNKLGTVRP